MNLNASIIDQRLVGTQSEIQQWAVEESKADQTRSA